MIFDLEIFPRWCTTWDPQRYVHDENHHIWYPMHALPSKLDHFVVDVTPQHASTHLIITSTLFCPHMTLYTPFQPHRVSFSVTWIWKLDRMMKNLKNTKVVENRILNNSCFHTLFQIFSKFELDA